MKEIIQKMLIIAFAVFLTITLLFSDTDSLKKDSVDLKNNTSSKISEATEALGNLN